MASLNERRQIGEEMVLAVRTTGSGVKVVQFDGTGLAGGCMSKRNRRYFYEETAEQKATEYAYNTVESIEDQRGVPVTVVELGEKMADKLGADDD